MSDHILILVRGEKRNYYLSNGKAVFSDLKAAVTVFTDEKNKDNFKDLDQNEKIHVVRMRRHSEILNLALKIHRELPITAVAAFSEEDVELASNIRESLGIPGTNQDTARKFRDKVYMKHCLQNTKTFRIPRFKEKFNIADAKDFLKRYGKIVVKPRSSQGSKGVAILFTENQIDKWFAKEECQEEFQLEEYVSGVLYHINSLVQGGESVFHSLAPYIPEMGNIDFNEGSPFVSVIETDSKIIDKLESVADEVIQKLSLNKGVIHLEVFLNSADEVIFCEVAARSGGGGIVAMIEESTGVNLNRELLTIELDRPWSQDNVASSQDKKSCGLIGIRNNLFGTVKSLPDPKSLNHEWIHRHEISISVGETALPASHCTDFSAFFIVSGSTYKETFNRIMNIHNSFKNELKVDSF